MIDHNQIEIARGKFGVSIDVSVAGDENGLSEAAIEIANKYGLSLEEDDVLGLMPDSDRIELGFGDAIRKVIETAAKSAAVSKAKGLVGDDDVKDPEFEAKHPRDSSGRFISKARAMAELASAGPAVQRTAEKFAEAGLNELTPYQQSQVVELLTKMPTNSDEWPGRDNERGIAAELNVSGMRVKVIGGVNRDDVTVAFIKQKLVENRMQEMGIDHNVGELTIVSSESRNSFDSAGDFEKYIKSSDYGNKDDIISMMHRGFGFVAMASSYEGSSGYEVMMDDGLLKAGAYDIYEGILAHEMLHTSTRENDQNFGSLIGNELGFIEESFNTIVQNEYADKYGLPADFSGHGPNVAHIAAAAQQRGMTKSEFYEFAREAHQIDGSDYKGLWSSMFEGTDVSPDIKIGNLGSAGESTLGIYNDSPIKKWWGENHMDAGVVQTYVYSPKGDLQEWDINRFVNSVGREPRSDYEYWKWRQRLFEWDGWKYGDPIPGG